MPLYLALPDLAIGRGVFLLAALFVIVGWEKIWTFASPYFALGPMIPLLVGACLLMMMGMLMFWRFFRELMFPERDASDEEEAAN